MKIESRPGFNTTRYKDIVYATDDVLSTKKRVHELYSSIPLDLNGEIYTFAGFKGTETLLDIGCGTGDFLMYLRQNKDYTGTLYGADLATGVFDKSRIISNERKLNIQFMEASILELPFKSKSVDIVTGLHMLSHVPVDRACDEVKRILKNDGKFVATANSLHSYPNVAKYRKLSFEMMGWGDPVFTTTSFNLENMEEKLSGLWAAVNVRRVHGELRIPSEEFLRYFYANMLVWEPMPTKEESESILKMVSKRLIIDAPDGFIIEPKYAGIVICYK